MSRIIWLISCLVVAVSGCGTAASRSDFVAVGDKRYAAVEFSTRHLVGPNLRELHTIEVDQDGKARVIHSSAATSSGFLQALLPSGFSAAIFTPVFALGKANPHTTE